MRIASVLLAGTLSLGVQRLGSAQGPSPSVLWQQPDTVFSVAPTNAVLRKALRAPDHRWEGMAIGAGVGAVAFGLLGAVACGQSDSVHNCTGIILGTGLLGAFAGGITGGLIGGGIPKSEPPDSTDRPS